MSDRAEPHDAKDSQLEHSRVDDTDAHLTTQQGIKVDHTDDSLSAGGRGPTLMDDFHFREKLTHFDHERIPERVVHARGAGAYGTFQAYDASLSDYTVAPFLTDPSVKTPVFVRFSTVAGSRGSADTVRDVRGFATKFYTEQGNYDLVGNNFPVFFIQDGIKFPDFVHAVKPEPHNEIPQAASAHDTLWDFVSLQPETLHAIMWLMSDRAIPRSYRMMQGFGVHTFRLVNAEGRGTFVKFHWTPLLGTHSLVWDEAQKIAGADADFNRRDLWEAIAAGNGPEWELGVQLVSENEEFEFEFDLLDATKVIPEEVVPVRPVGRMVLNRNPENFFAETEQVAFHTANVVPGIDFTNDPLLQARNFSYLDTQLIRLGGPNFAQIPVNRPVAPVHNNQRDGYGQQRIHRNRAAYSESTVGGGCPAIADSEVFKHYTEKIEGHKIRQRSESFQDHYSQATLFWNSMTDPEKAHIVDAFRFELGKVGDMDIRQRAVEQINNVDHSLAREVAAGIGVVPPSQETRPNHGQSSPALSQLREPVERIDTRQVAILAADGVDGGGVTKLRRDLSQRGASVEVLGLADGGIRSADGVEVKADRAMSTVASVLYDAVVVPCGPDSVAALKSNGHARHFVSEAFKHGKPVAAFGKGIDLLRVCEVFGQLADSGAVALDRGVVTTTAMGNELPDEFVDRFAQQVAKHRSWDRDTGHIAA
ncbi:catalase [Natronoglycomyces albus]|uniref:Catalase n=1 Tax=Natronoglycomyces albus TaxID=2811108 RepID=A0A895XLJ0_9ACTN|nr:catalase [Natronoglycomyces albus]QSB04662.1 catalase [Natronoglycomyces albus]